jgi:hypothetical protein
VSAGYGPFPAHAQYSGDAQCPAGNHAIGGGAITDGQNAGEQELNSSYPDDAAGNPGNTGWLVAVDNLSSGQLGFTVYAICAPAGTVTGP